MGDAQRGPSLRRELRGLLRRHGIAPSRARGQNFLVDGALLAWIAQRADLSRSDVVLEVGGGTGLLTRELARRAASVLVVEVDRGLAACLRVEFPLPGVQVLHADVLERGRRLNGKVVRALGELLPPPQGGTLKCVANLPYSVAVPAILALLRSGLPFTRFVVLVQKEVADRLTAGPGTGAWGLASVLVQMRASTRRLRVIRPERFWPPPRVDSAVLLVEPLARPAGAADLPPGLERLARRLFQHRRKRIPGALAHGGADRAAVLAALAEAGIDPSRRGEELDLGELAALSRSLRGLFL